MVGDTDLEQRVAALEEMLANPARWFVLPAWQPLTPEQEAEIRKDIEAVAAEPYKMRVIEQPPPFTKDEVRQILRECVTVVQPGEHLILRVPWTASPTQVRELQDFANQTMEWLGLPFRMLVLPGDELGVTQP